MKMKNNRTNRLFILILGCIIGTLFFPNLTYAANQTDKDCESPKTIIGEKKTVRVNEYCTTECQPMAKTNFPTEVPFVSVDQYDKVLGGSHFNWDEIKINVQYKCVTNIDYYKWKADYEEAIKIYKHTLREIAREAHQYHTDTIVETDEVVYEEKLTETTKEYYDDWVGRWERYYEKTRVKLQLKSGEYEWTKPYKKEGGWIRYNTYSGKCTSDPENKNEQESGATSAEKAIVRLNNQGYKARFYPTSYGCVVEYYQNTKYYYYKPEKKTCQSHVYKRVTCGDNASTCEEKEKVQYCNESKPYWDNGDFDKFWYDTLRNAYSRVSNTTSSLKGLLGKCNENGINTVKDTMPPNVNIRYKDARKTTGEKYTDAENLKLDRVTIKSFDTSKPKRTTVANRTIPLVTSRFESSIKASSWKSIVGSGISVIYNESRQTLSEELANTRVETLYDAEYKFNLPKDIYRYVLKTPKEAGKAVSTNPIVKGKNYAQIIDKERKDGTYRFIDLEKSTYPVHYTVETGKYKIGLSYSVPLVFSGQRDYNCFYKVINRIKCATTDCTPDTSTPDDKDSSKPGNSGETGTESSINVIYRPISLTNPFPGERGTGRNAGNNWSSKDIISYITNNRKVKQNNVYKQTPLYSFTLDAKAINNIKRYNKGLDKDTGKTRDYDDFNLKCSQKYGKRCKSKFLTNIKGFGVVVNKSTCYNKTASEFYSCANKPDQDDIRCYLNKKNKLVCIDCKQNKTEQVCK